MYTGIKYTNTLPTNDPSNFSMENIHHKNTTQNYVKYTDFHMPGSLCGYLKYLMEGEETFL